MCEASIFFLITIVITVSATGDEFKGAKNTFKRGDLPWFMNEINKKVANLD